MAARLVPWLVATALFVAGAAAGAVERLGSVGDWTLRADRFADGAPYCWIVADRAPGDRLTFLRSEVGLAVILTRRSWDLVGPDRDVEVRVDASWRGTREAAVGPRTLVLHWPRPEAIRRALAAGDWLAVAGARGEVDVRWRLTGAARALSAVDGCWKARLAGGEPIS